MADSATPRASSTLEERPGLGTQLGHKLHDVSRTGQFFRKHSSLPDAVARFFYNDEEGARLMSELELGKAPRESKGSFDLIPGRLRATVQGGGWSGANALPYFDTGHRVIVAGTAGQTYSIRLENLSKSSAEVVVTVDGLDVLDAKPGSVKKRGYVIEAENSIVIRGMRADGALRAFQFGTVADSQAATSLGEKGARNVGVIGVALYLEDEAARRRAQVEESNTRDNASAFGL